ncbi:PRADC1-like protein isoform X1 [Penaeus vannamei]|uniref:PRADC1-like protein isoform X1 n=1 Tax=Penaeus vannamei TaxID=6689 RepID=UPI000F65DE3F|nr:PRADC1-like protein isoform X1 [Penaeus vannamei]
MWKNVIISLFLAVGFCPYECVRQEMFSNAIWNEATIYDFIEDDIFFEIIYPEELSYTYRLRQAKDFGVSFSHVLKSVRLVLADPLECCSLPYNAMDLQGAVALVSRGDCSFVSKAVKAEQSGAIAVIVMDNNADNDELYIEMVDDNTNREPAIPAAFLLGRSGFMITKTLRDMHMEAAVINIPVNLTSVPFHKLNQPPWILW